MKALPLTLAASLGLLLLLPAARVQAQDLCLPEASGVPYTGGAAPDWYSGPLAAPKDDPGWVGATQTGHGLAADHAVVRGLKDGTSDLFLSFHSEVALDSAFPDAELWLGFDDGTNTRVYLINVPHTSPTLLTADPIRCFDSSASPPAHCANAPDRSFRVLTATSGSNPTVDPTETTATTWPHTFGRVWTRTGDFAIFLRVPLASLGVTPTGNTLKFWYQLTVKDSAGIVDAPVARFPDSATAASFNSGFGLLTAPTVAEWGTLRIGTGAPTCRDGVFVDRANSGVAHGSAAGALTSRIVGQDGGADVANFFVARPQHSSGGALPAGLEGRFRIADWGSSPPAAPGAWTPVSQRIAEAGGTASDWVALSSGAITQGPWTLTSNQRCDYSIPVSGTDDACAGSSTHDDHQCVLTEIRATGGGGDILRDSIYKNTNFVNLSEFERVATIGAQGISASGDLDYYLYVDVRNMPVSYPAPTDPRSEVLARATAIAARIKQRYSPPAAVVARLQEAIERGDQRAAARLKDLIAEAGARIPATTTVQLAEIEKLLASNKPLLAAAGLDTETIETIMPTMLVHVFRDSGRRYESDGKQVKVLTPQPGFGYYARHQGNIGGWSAVLDGAERIGNSNWYRLSVAAGGTKKINTRLQARADGESPLVADPGWQPPSRGETNRVEPQGEDEVPWWKKYWWMLAIALAIVLAGFLVLRRRSS